MKIYIPEIGDQIVLTKDWTFDLYYEYRNKSLLEKIDVNFEWRPLISEPKPEQKYSITIPKKTILRIDRIYVRKGASNYSSLSFIIDSGEWKKCRFWAKLFDVNNIEFDYNHIKKGINVTFSSPYNYNVLNTIIKSESYSWRMTGLLTPIKCMVNGELFANIIPHIETRKLSEEECKNRNKQIICRNKFERSRFHVTTEDYIVTKFELVTILASTGEEISRDKTTKDIAKKIKTMVK